MRLSSIIVVGLLSVFGFTSSFGIEKSTKERSMGLYSGKDKIGYSVTKIITNNGGREASERTKLKLTVLGKDQEVDTSGRYLLDGYKLKSFEFLMKAGLVDLKVTGVRNGDNLKMRVVSASGSTELDIPIDEEPVIGPVLYDWLVSKNPEPGKSYEAVLFDPTVLLTGAELRSSRAILTVEGKEEISTPLGTYETYRVTTKYLGSEDTAWVTPEGELIKEVSELGIVSLKENREDLIADNISSLDIVGKTAVSSNLKIENPRDLEFLRMKISGIESTEGLDLTDDYRQFIKDGLLEVRVGSLSEINTYDIPYTAGALEEYTQESILIQSKDGDIVRTAGAILGGEKNALEAVRKINNWVYENLERTPTISVPNALDVLKSRKGDCNEHATLFTALARAAGIPTKLVLGLVFLDGKFYYHAWNEAFVGEWIAVDPTFGQLPADASHVKFVEGNLDKSSEILRLVGKIELDVVEAS